MSQNVIICILDILQQLIDEAAQVPMEVVDQIMENMYKKKKVLCILILP
jgi:hypothetical protein